MSTAAKIAAVPANLDTPTDLPSEGVAAITATMNGLVADSFALYLKTKNFHWHISGPHFRDYHLLLDEQSASIFESIDVLAERVRKIGGDTIRSIGHVAKLQTIKDNNEEFVSANDMLHQLMEDNKYVTAAMRKAHEIADKYQDAATASILENTIDETEKRTWFLFEASRVGDRTGH